MKRVRKNREVEDFQMAPMIDMVFLLLVFFMCVSSLASADKSIEVDLPVSAESKVPEDLSGRGIISVQADGSVFMGARAVSLEELKASVTARLRETPGLRIQVRADGATKFEEIQRVLKSCAEAGAVDVIYSTYQSH